MITVTIMKKKINTRAGIFKNMVGNIPGGNFPGEGFTRGSLIGVNFPGGSFPDTEENICEEFSSVNAFAHEATSISSLLY